MLTLKSCKEEFEVTFIKRDGYPFKDKWALSRGFMEEDETVRRELFEETEVDNIHLEQLCTFSELGRYLRGKLFRMPI